MRLKAVTGQRNKRNELLLMILAAMIGLVIFPYGWLAQTWPAFAQVTNRLFSSELSRVIGHTTMFMLLGTAVLHIFPCLQRRQWLYLALMLSIGLIQESLQLVSFKGRPFSLAEIADLIVDGLASWAAFQLWRRYRQAILSSAFKFPP